MKVVRTDKKPKRRSRELHDALVALIERSQAGAQLPSYADMQARYGASQSTINSVLVGLEKAGLIERRPWKGIFVSDTAKRNQIALVFDRNVFTPGVSPVFAQFLATAQHRAKEHGEDVRFYIDTLRTDGGFYSHSDLVRDVDNAVLQGAILLCGRSPEEIRFFCDLPVPTAIYSPISPAPNSVEIDYPRLIALGVASLAQKGCRRVGFVSHLGGGWPETPDKINGLEIFRRAVAETGMEIDEDWVLEADAISGRADENRLYQSNEEIGRDLILSRRQPPSGARKKNAGSRLPDGLVVTDDMLARGVLIAIEREFGLHVPGDVQIATHSNRGSGALFGYEGGLIRLEIDPVAIVDALFELVETQIQTGKRTKQRRLIRPVPIPAG